MNGTGAVKRLRIDWQNNILAISGTTLPTPVVEVHYLEAFCQPDSHERDWADTIILHRTELLERDADGGRLRLESRLSDGVVITHDITTGVEDVDFRLTAVNPTHNVSRVHWAQPCIRVGEFTGCAQVPDDEAYIRKCFIFENGNVVRMPTSDWVRQARYTPGQVWCPTNVPRSDVNPRPLNAVVPSCGLIGCFSCDEACILATAWEPYQELFQGVVQCIHSDFRIGGLAPGESKEIRGKIYIVRGGLSVLLDLYRSDFPEHVN